MAGQSVDAFTLDVAPSASEPSEQVTEASASAKAESESSPAPHDGAAD